VRIYLFVFLGAAILIGCAGSGAQEPIAPPASVAPAAASTSNRYVWGLWDVQISSDRQTAEVTPWRSADMHLNVVRLLEVTPCSTCLAIGNIHMVEPNVLEADLTLTHPFPGLLKFTGFDVRGIFISEANFTFPVSGRKIAWGTDVPVVLNPDGYTSLFNPTEFPETQPGPPALRYIPGKYATGGDLSATLNPYLAYRRDAPRCMFEAGGSEARTIRLYAPSGPIHFGYAVDACWQLVENVVDPLTDFPPDANCLEAYRVNVDLPYDLNSSWMSQNPINVEIFDHQGLETVATVTVESPGLFSGETPLALSTQTGEDSWLFSGMITNETAATQGNYPLLVKVTDAESDQNLGTILGWSAGLATVKAGWARTWSPGYVEPRGHLLAVDGLGNVYVTGYFAGTGDFDPGPGEDWHSSIWGASFLMKFDSAGTFQWARTWGEDGIACGCAVSTEASGDVYVTGFFDGTVDFDPGPGEDWHTSGETGDAFVCKFDPSGTFLWARTWGGDGSAGGYGVAADISGNAFVAGGYTHTVDFDPGSGVDNHTSNGGSDDAFLSKFDSSGAFIWAMTWGSYIDECGKDVVVDGAGDAFVAGDFHATVDFDPGSGVDIHTPVGDWDIYLSKFSSSGGFLWAITWGGENWDECDGVASDGTGNVYVAGWFYDAVDFDPGPGEEWHTSNGYSDGFLSKIDSSGSLLWAKTWGGDLEDLCEGVASDGSGDAFVTGAFSETVDFDPGPGEDWHSTEGYSAFLSKFDSSGVFTWARTWDGGPSSWCGSGVSLAACLSGETYVTGYFYGSVDFDPGPGEDWHTSTGDTDIYLSKFPPDGNW